MADVGLAQARVRINNNVKFTKNGTERGKDFNGKWILDVYDVQFGEERVQLAVKRYPASRSAKVNIFGNSANKFGNTGVKSILNFIKKQYKDVEYVYGDRISGARKQSGKLLNSAGIRIRKSVEASSKEYYGDFWITDKGEIVRTNGSHCATYLRHLKLSNNLPEKFNEQIAEGIDYDEVYAHAAKSGYIRVVADGSSINMSFGLNSITNEAVKKAQTVIRSGFRKFYVDIMTDFNKGVYKSRTYDKYGPLSKLIKENISNKIEASNNEYKIFIEANLCYP